MTNGIGAMPKVMLVSHHASRRGSAISLIELGLRLPAHGYRPLFVFSKAGELADELVHRGLEVHRIERRGWLRWSTIRKFQQLIRAHQIVLVHANSAVPFSKYAALAAWLCDIPVVWHIREPVADKRMRRLRPWIVRLARRIVVLTREQAAFFSTPDKVRRIFNGVDLERFANRPAKQVARQHLGLPLDALLFLQIGSIEINKGQIRTLSAFEKLLPLHPRVHLALLGAAVEKSAQHQIVEFLARRPAVAKNVVVAGVQQDVRPWLAAADCLLLPSLHESFPRAAMEALASGVPVIASRVGALSDMVEEGDTGWLIPPGDAEILFQRMADFCRLPEEIRYGFASRCQQSARKLFSLETHVQQICALYSELVPPAPD